MYSNLFYETYKHDVYSQNGEDGLVRAIVEKLGVQKGWVCEFGAWDGKYLSNTFALVEKGFKAVYIEGDPQKFNDLLLTCREFPNITPVRSMVDTKLNSLDNILRRTDIPDEFLLLSIDIDSYDYHVWESFTEYHPLIVIIEINSSVDPTRMDWIHGAQPGMELTGFAPMLALAQQKGYQLLAHTGNMVFLRNDIASQFPIPEDPLTCFRTNWMK